MHRSVDPHQPTDELQPRRAISHHFFVRRVHLGPRAAEQRIPDGRSHAHPTLVQDRRVYLNLRLLQLNKATLKPPLRRPQLSLSELDWRTTGASERVRVSARVHVRRRLQYSPSSLKTAGTKERTLSNASLTNDLGSRLCSSSTESSTMLKPTVRSTNDNGCPSVQPRVSIIHVCIGIGVEIRALC